MSNNANKQNGPDPAKMREWEQASQRPPAGRGDPKGQNQENPKNKTEKGGLKGKGEKDAPKGQDANQRSERTSRIPSDIQAQFPDADLSKVPVILDSREAQQQGVEGFFKDGTIHVAPNADAQKVLRHEAAHAAQALKGGGKEKKGGGQGEEQGADSPASGHQNDNDGANPQGQNGNEQGPAPRDALEGQARQAEDGQPVTGDATQNADPSQQYNSDAKNLNETGFPKLEWNGTKFDKVSGSFEKELLKADWDEKKLCEGEVWWRIPVFPAAGVYVKAGVNFKPEATLKAKANYSWSPEGNKFEVSGTLEGELKAALTGYVEGGVGLNLVIQKGGVGIRGSIALEAAAKLSRGISFSVSNEGVNFRMTPLEFEIGAALKAALTARAWTEGWLWDAATEWTFAEFTIATLTAAKVQICIDAGSQGVAGRVGTVTPGTLKWGSAPPCTDQNGKEV